MSNVNVPQSEQATVVAAINPASVSAGAVSTGWLSMAQFEAAQAIILTGALGTSGTVDAKIEQAKDASGAAAKDVPGKALTQLTQAASKSNKQAVINITTADMDMANDYSHIRLTLNVGTAASLLSAVVVAANFRYAPTPINTVTEVIA